MDKTWLEVMKATGSVGVIAFLAYQLINFLYSDKILELFGSEKMFALSITIVAAVFIILLVAVLKKQEKVDATGDKSTGTEGSKVTYQDKATHNGDNNF